MSLSMGTGERKEPLKREWRGCKKRDVAGKKFKNVL